MKKILTMMLALLALTFVSCNLDSSQGIFDAIQDAKPQDENAVADLAGRYHAADGYHYVFNTTKGIALDEHSNLIIRNDNAVMTVHAIAVDQKGNILVAVDDKKTGTHSYRVWNGTELVSSPAASAFTGSVYQTANFHDNAYDIIMMDIVEGKTVFTLYSTNDLVDLLVADAWDDPVPLDKVSYPDNSPVLVGHKAYGLRSKNASLTDEQKVIHVVGGADVAYNKSFKIDAVHYLAGDLTIADGKLYNRGEEIKVNDKSLNIPVFFYTINGNIITGVGAEADGKMPMFQIDTATNAVTLKTDKDSQKKKVLGIKANGGNKFNVVLYGQYDYEVEF